MTELYESKWTRDKGDVGGAAFQAWVDEFTGVPPERIKRGLDALRCEMPEWPPTLIEFMRLCAGGRQPPQTYSSRNFTEERIAQQAHKRLTHIRGGDSAVAKAEKRKQARIRAGEDVESLADSYERLNLTTRWGPITTGAGD